MNRETVGERLAKIRIQRGYSQRKLAAKLGIGHTLISDYERGRLRLHDGLIIKLAQVLEIPSDIILGLNKKQELNHTARLRITKRVKQIEELPEPKQKTVLRMIDGYVRGAKEST